MRVVISINSHRVSLALTVPIAAPAQQVWDAIVDWEGQSEWMLATQVSSVGAREGVGARVEAFTGLLPQRRLIGFLDTMVVTAWDPPRRCDVLHTGRVVRGTGTFEVEAVDQARSLFHWSEELELPWGVLGRIGWIFVAPGMRLGVRISLRRLAQRLSTAAQR